MVHQAYVGWLIGVAGTLALALPLAGCDVPGLQGDAHRAARSMLNDPGSAQFQSERVVSEKGAVCGLVNAKNAMGGYVGFRPYVYYKPGLIATSDGPPNYQGYVNDIHPYYQPAFQRAFEKLTAACDFHDTWKENCGGSLFPDQAKQDHVCSLARTLAGQNQLDKEYPAPP